MDFQSNANNNNYNYGHRPYRPNVSEPGGSLAAAAMVLGIVSIALCFSFTVYPAFICGSIAIVLALLSKGRRDKHLSKARAGIICGACGLILNTVLTTCLTVLLFTNDEVRTQVNDAFKKQYGQTFDEMMEEIMENGGYFK